MSPFTAASVPRATGGGVLSPAAHALDGLVFESAAGLKSARLADLVGSQPSIRSLDAKSVAARAMLLSLPAGATVWRGIRAHGGERADASEEWSDPLPTTEAAAPVFLRRALEAAVDRALMGAKRVAVMTGGGVDSSVLLALVVAWAKRDPARSAFGVGMDFGGEGDDRPYLAALERHLGCEILRVRPEDAGHRVALVLRGVDAAPFTWPGGPMEVEALCRARVNGADVCAMGVGADELFDGVPQSLADVAREGRPFEALRRARRLRAFTRPSRPTFTWVARPLIAARLPRAVRAWYWRRAGEIAPDWAGPLLRNVFADDSATYAEMLGAFAASRPDARARFQQWRRAANEEHIVWLKHQEQIAAGIVRRDPYDDPGLARSVTALPPSWLLHGDIRRGLFREAVRGLVPDALRLRVDKASFEEGFARFVEGAGGFAMLRPFARADRLADLGIVEPRALSAAFEELAANATSSWGWGSVWPAIAVEAFLRSLEEPR